MTDAELDEARRTSTKTLLAERRIRRAYEAWLAGTKFQWWHQPALGLAGEAGETFRDRANVRALNAKAALDIVEAELCRRRTPPEATTPSALGPHTCACGAVDEASGYEWPRDGSHHPDGCPRAPAAAPRTAPPEDMRERLEEAIKRGAAHCKHTTHGQRTCVGCAAMAAARELTRDAQGFAAPAPRTADAAPREDANTFCALIDAYGVACARQVVTESGAVEIGAAREALQAAIAAEQTKLLGYVDEAIKDTRAAEATLSSERAKREAAESARTTAEAALAATKGT